LNEEAPKSSSIQLATRYRYSLPVLAELQRDSGCKFVTLINRLGASDRAIRQALDHLTAVGWVIRNPGYGHPMRPEYILTGQEDHPAERALEIWDALRDWGNEDVALERWPLPILQTLIGGPKRFSQIQKVYDGLTPRSLTLGLTKLLESGLALRTVVDGQPPTAEYSATNWGRELLGEGNKEKRE
jgi:DNA-binding HxlR family transcriptional regulator